MTVSFSSYDEPLGPRAGRYFGEGYKKVGPELIDLRIARSTGVGAMHTAVARLSYPGSWSTKSGGELVPHVSSVDTVMLATSLCDAAITHARDLGPAESARMWVRQASVRAGAAPHEDLDHIPVHAEVVSESVADGGEVATGFKFRVGNLTGNLTIVHPVGSGSLDLPGVDHVAGLSDIFGPAPHYYLNGVKDHTLTATDLIVDPDAGRIVSRQHVHSGVEGGYVGAESAWWSAVSPVDAIVGVAQLSQILLYQLDSMTRRDSNTLWMRKLEFFAEDPRLRSSDEPFDGVVEVRRASTIDRGGQRWRSADLLIKEFRGVTGTTLLAHQLPD
ncbi:AvrD family protein [Nocardia puris]|uniref:Avirulence D protein (AvrD) n=1 Tax=Nocardia puris TaxID=208602 RepID=A0A366D4U8_9NOCA|nr:AvrD family protein [Nocardia puris]RBO84549.1 avirulence D protein (AvrD) [Nocardia puris]